MKLSTTLSMLICCLLFSLGTHAVAASASAQSKRNDQDGVIELYRDKDFQGDPFKIPFVYDRCYNAPFKAWIESVKVPQGTAVGVYSDGTDCHIDDFSFVVGSGSTNLGDGKHVWSSWRMSKCTICVTEMEDLNNNLAVTTNDSSIAQLFANSPLQESASQVVDLPKDAIGHEARHAAPKSGHSGFSFGSSKSEPDTPSKKKEKKKKHDKCEPTNHTSNNCSDASSLVPMRKLLGVALGAGVLAGAGM